MFARLAYSHSTNLGDQIQSLATERFLGEKPLSVERHELKAYEGEKVILLMQGYFVADNYRCAFPPSKNIVPVFVGFHIANIKTTLQHYSSPETVNYLKQYAPIGCRDGSTVSFLRKKGIEAYLSRCLTLTFPRRDENVVGKSFFFVDTPEWLKPSRFTNKRFNEMYKAAVFLSQETNAEGDDEKRQIALERIEMLKNEAKLVVTTRLHIASPCIAMGIPTVLILPLRYPKRFDMLKGIIPFYRIPNGKDNFLKKIIRTLFINFFIDWHPVSPDIENLKTDIITDVETKISKALNQ